jgi:ParB family chromosome partitioning protein
MQLIDHLKKSEMAKEAERLLEDTRWLPEPLRLAEVAPPSEVKEALPGFLSDERQAGEVDESGPTQAIAAE